MPTKQQEHERDRDNIRLASITGYDVGEVPVTYRTPNRKQVMQAADRNTIKMQQHQMSENAQIEMAHQAARDARKTKTAAEYKGVK